MADQVYDALQETVCPLCLAKFEDGTVVSFHSPCWVHPMCGECRNAWRENQLTVLGVYPTCPYCKSEYSIFDAFRIKLEPWHEREEVDYPPPPDGRVVEDNKLIGHQAPCCGKGYKAGDYVVSSACGRGGGQVHYMHSWCYLVNRMRADGSSLHYEDPFDCFTCGCAYAPTNAVACCELKGGGNGSDGDQQEYYEAEDGGGADVDGH